MSARVIEQLLANGHLEVQPTFFEVTTAAAFEIFRRRQVDVAVVEVGLGGRLDATNVITPLVIGDHLHRSGPPAVPRVHDRGDRVREGRHREARRAADCRPGQRRRPDGSSRRRRPRAAQQPFAAAEGVALERLGAATHSPAHAGARLRRPRAGPRRRPPGGQRPRGGPRAGAARGPRPPRRAGGRRARPLGCRVAGPARLATPAGRPRAASGRRTQRGRRARPGGVPRDRRRGPSANRVRGDARQGRGGDAAGARAAREPRSC